MSVKATNLGSIDDSETAGAQIQTLNRTGFAGGCWSCRKVGGESVKRRKLPVAKPLAGGVRPPKRSLRHGEVYSRYRSCSIFG